MRNLILFVILQLGDAGTTLTFIRRGVAEANPLVSGALGAAANPAVALAAVKLAGCALAFYAWRSGRTRLLLRANVFFGLCIAWNLLAIAAS